MIFPTKEVYLEDVKKQLSYPGDTHDEDIKFHTDVTEYKKSPLQSIHEIFLKAEPIISDEKWFELESQAKGLIKAVPEFVAGVSEAVVEDVKNVGKALTGQPADEKAMRASARKVIDPGIKIAHSLLETFVLRNVEPARAFVGSVVTGKAEEAVPSALEAFVTPSETKKIASPESVPFTQKELSGGIAELIPRALLLGVEDVIFYGSNLSQVPKLLDNYKINQVKNILKDSTSKVHEQVKLKLGLDDDAAWEYMKDSNFQAVMYRMAEKEMSKPKLYSGLPVPDGGKMKAAGEAIAKTGEEVVKEGAKKAIAGEVAKETLSSALKTRSFVTSVQEEMPQLKVAGQYIPRDTDELSIKANNLIKDDLITAEKMALNGTDDESIAVAAQLLKHYYKEADKATDEAVKQALYSKGTELANKTAERLTELGRAVQAASILSRMTPEGQIRFAANEIRKYNEGIDTNKNIFKLKEKVPELTPEQARYIKESMEDIIKMPDGKEKAIKFQNLQNYISDLVPTPLMKKLSHVWKAGLLTGFKTHGLNMFSNFSHAFGTEILKDIPAAGVDKIASLFTKERTTAFTLQGLPGGVKDGFIRGWEFLQTGYDERNALSKLDYKRVNMGKSPFAKALQGYSDGVFKLLGAQDQVFYYGSFARSIADQAIARAKTQGLKGKEKEDFINNLIADPSDDMVLFARADAEQATFQNKTLLSEVASKLKKVPIFEFVIPFSKTPSAVAMQIINYSPVGAVKTVYDSIKTGEFDQRGFSKGMGRAILGLPLLWLGYKLYQDGRLTLSKPKAEKEIELAEAENKKFNSVKIGNDYRSLQIFGPANNLMLLGGAFAQALDKSGSPSEAISIALASGGKSFTEQTFVTGINRALDAITDPQRNAEYFASGLVGSFVPTIVADVGRAMDDKERRVESIKDAVMARIPVVRNNLQPKVDFLGKEREIKENFFETMFDPTRPQEKIIDPLVVEIRRLADAGFPPNTTKLGDKEGYKVLTPEQNTQLWETAGQIAYDKIASYMQMPEYEQLDDEQRQKNIDKIIDRAKINARASILVEMTVDKSQDEVVSILKKAKEDKLLTKEVLKEYQKVR